jgi:hypothetical protein
MTTTNTTSFSEPIFSQTMPSVRYIYHRTLRHRACEASQKHRDGERRLRQRADKSSRPPCNQRHAYYQQDILLGATISSHAAIFSLLMLSNSPPHSMRTHPKILKENTNSDWERRKRLTGHLAINVMIMTNKTSFPEPFLSQTMPSFRRIYYRTLCHIACKASKKHINREHRLRLRANESSRPPCNQCYDYYILLRTILFSNDATSSLHISSDPPPHSMQKHPKNI